jgi:Gelsolin repeat
MPLPLPLTSERLERHGLFLIEDGQTLFLWVGRDAVPQLIIDVFDLPNYETLRGGKVYFLAVQYQRTIKLTRLDSRPHFRFSTIRSRNV